MANTVNVGLTTTSNTFNQWRITDNLMANDVNEIVRGNFTKPAGNVTLSDGILAISKTSGVTFTVASDARIAGLASIHSIEADADGHVYIPSGDITMANRSSGGLFQANINTVFTSANVTISNSTGTFNVSSNTTISASNVTISNTSAGGTFNVAPNTTISALRINFSNSNPSASFNISPNTNISSNLFVAGLTNSISGNITTLWVQDLTVQNAISAPAETTGSEYRLRANQGSRLDGYFGVGLGTSANGNAWIRFDTSSGNVWRVTENSTAGIYKTLLTTGNISDSVATSSSSNVASLTAVKAAYDQATSAYNAANNAKVTVFANRASSKTTQNINFVNTSTITVSVTSSGSNANVSFTAVGGAAYDQANSAYSQANNAYSAANSAYSQANNAYSAANNLASGTTQITLKGYKDYIVTNATVTGANTVDLSVSNWYKYTLTGNSTITFANAPAVGNGGTVTIVTIQGTGGNKNITWANTIYWAGGQVPPISNTAAGNTDIWTFFTFDGGSTYIGTLAVKDAR